MRHPLCRYTLIRDASVAVQHLSNMLTRPSIADIPEHSLVERLMEEPHWRCRLLEIYGIPTPSIPFQRVHLSGLTGKSQGDVDILLSVPGRPDMATAIEVKRIKVSAKGLRNQRPNKLSKLKKSVRQANQLAGIGFSQVYLYVFVVVDSREKNAGRYAFEGLPVGLRSSIERDISPSGLDNRVGLMYHEFVQHIHPDRFGRDVCGHRLLRGRESTSTHTW